MAIAVTDERLGVFPSLDTKIEQAPCRVACPLHTDAQGYIWLIAQGRYREAFEVAKAVNPLVSAIARVCAHPCETKCRRAQVDEPISICALKRFAVDWGRDVAGPAPVPPRRYEERVAVIGGGPAGLTAASDLARLGYAVTVFEKNPVAGGIFQYGIPTYRLPRTELAEDVAAITALGVDIQTGVEVGKDIKVADLFSQGYQSVLVAVGLSVSRGLPIPGANLPGVLMALPFLAEVNATGKCKDMPEGASVIVIGGGNVAIDVARSAWRAGASRVQLACLESEEEIPASPWEVEEAAEEGVEINCSWGPTRILEKDGSVAGLELQACTCVFDTQHRFAPQFDECTLNSLDGDLVIFAIGQGSDLALAKDTDIQLNPRGQLIADRNKFTTTMPGVFACGEVMLGPGNAVTAMGSAHKAAMAIHCYLRQIDMPPSIEDTFQALGEVAEPTIEYIPPQKRQKMPVSDPMVRRRSTEAFEYGFSERQALAEARRCLNCASGAEAQMERCANCLTCLRVCPFGVPVIGDEGKVQIRFDQCQACGICARECPASIIDLRRDQHETIGAQLEAIGVNREALAAVAEPVIVVYRCRYGWLAPDEPDGVAMPQNARIVDMLCSARVDVQDILQAFTLGADGVMLAVCAEDDCHLKGVARVRARAMYTQQILDAVGLGAGRLEVVELASPVRETFRRSVEDMTARLAALGKSPAGKHNSEEK
jgi:NADPH-dependent glutamate synthase beta subunit-like oxidoreductase/coenzyme F420-reducing hydrogenase delta subunit/Pyruvate/2-oxoacid:ferredoxin oxidoreductase delta subunit